MQDVDDPVPAEPAATTPHESPIPSSASFLRAKRWLYAGLIITIGSPGLGLLVAIVVITISFQSVEGNATADQASVLGDSITLAMNTTAVGVALGMVGAVITIVAVVALNRARQRERERSTR